MANTGQPNSAGSQYFITVEPFTSGNYTYAAFGNVIEGFDVVDAINVVPTTGPNGNPANKPLIDVEIDSIRIVTPQLYEIVPPEHELTADAGGYIVFAVYSYDSNLTYQWYVNDELQTETSNVFFYSFPLGGTYQIKSLVSNGEYEYPTIWTVEVAGAGAGVAVTPGSVRLHQNYPNPFNPSTTFSFSLNQEISTDARIEVFNSRGQIVKTLSSEGFTSTSTQDAFSYSVIWDGTDNEGAAVTSGVYLYRMKSGTNSSDLMKCVLMK